MKQKLVKPYCQSILRIQVPLVVTLARQPMRIDRVMKLVPGVMIQFGKSCDSPMTVEVSDQPIAEGEIVKKGDKFGIRIGSILKPAERFLRITNDSVGEL